MKRPGEPARLTYDTTSVVHVGDYVRTSTGRTYLVTDARLVRTRLDQRRWALDTVVMEPDHQLLEDDVVHTLRWYRR